MAVEARHLMSLFPPQIVNSRDLMMNSSTLDGSNGNMYGGYRLLAPPLSATTEPVVPMYGSVVTADVMKATAAINKSDSGLTYTAVPCSRKRSRDAINPPVMAANNCPFTFLGEDMSIHLQHQQLEIDQFIAQQSEKARVEIEERRKRHCRRIAVAVEETISKRLRAREEEIEKIGRLNFALEERVKSLCVENQIWRELAQTNEATANALRCNLEQVLQQQAQVLQDDNHQHGDDYGEDDAQSCCASNFNNEMNGGVRNNNNNITAGGRSRNNCRSCGKEESCVLVLPCRHLCLCTVCGSSRDTCPVCCSVKTASLHVALS